MKRIREREEARRGPRDNKPKRRGMVEVRVTEQEPGSGSGGVCSKDSKALQE